MSYICSICQMPLAYHEEIIGHTCIEIKEETVEDMISVPEDINDESNLYGNDSDFSPKVKKRKLEQSQTNKEQNKQIESEDLEFIVFILKQVDELCTKIENGDSDERRARKVNENLNTAVNSYRNVLDFGKETFVESEYFDDIGVESDLSGNDSVYSLIESENEDDIKYVFHDLSEESVKKSKLPEENEKIQMPKKKLENLKAPEDKTKRVGNNNAISYKMTSREIFMERISEMRSKQASNNRAITQEGYANIIKKLKQLVTKVPGKSIPGFSTNDYNLANTHEILTVEKNGTMIEILVRPGKEDTNKKLEYITVEKMFDVVNDIHKKSKHGGRDEIHPVLMEKYANITQKQCQVFVNSCEQCQIKKVRSKKGIVF